MAESPPVTPAEILEDQQWFADHPHRQYRLRPGWALRRRSRCVFLRTPHTDTRTYPDSERLAERLWWENAWPHLSPLARARLAKDARWRPKPRPPAYQNPVPTVQLGESKR